MKKYTNMEARRLLFRALLVFAWALALAALFVNARGHTLLVDNAASGGLAAFENVKVAVNGAKPVSFMPGDRERFFVSGGKARIKLEAGKGEHNPALPFEAVVRLPLRPDSFLLSLPRLAAGLEALSDFSSSAPPPEDGADGGDDTAAGETQKLF